LSSPVFIRRSISAGEREGSAMETEGTSPPEEEQHDEGHSTILSLGQSVVAWSTAERGVETLLLILLLERGLIMGDATIVAANLDVRERSKMALALAYQTGVPQRRLKAIEALLNRIQNDLRNQRNRLYHDGWRFRDGGLQKRSYTGTRLHRKQAHKIELIVPDFEPITAQGIKAFVEECLKVADDMVEQSTLLVEDLKAVRKAPQAPKSPAQSRRPSKFWRRLLQRSD
jgi:hypothetical protein